MLEISVTNERQRRSFTHKTGPLEFGRADSAEGKRFVVEDRYVSRDQLRIEELPEARVRVTNLGRQATLASGESMSEGESRDLDLPARVTIGYTLIEMTTGSMPAVAANLQTIAPPVRRDKVKKRGSSIADLGDSPAPAKLAAWFETLLSVQRAAAGSAEFYDETARAVVELIGLDRGLVVLSRGDQWQVAANHGKKTARTRDYSRTVLRQVSEQRRTFYRSPQAIQGAESLKLLEAVVAAPVFDSEEEVVGVLFGSRDSRGGDARNVTVLEAQLVQLLAGTVSAGLVRMDREAEAARSRVQLEQFVSPQVARELERNPDALEGHDREITVLFADIRGFSRIAERLDARETYRLAGDVLDRLTSCVMEHAGTIIDYYGDGFAAMWNAPAEQPNHAALACRAALEMIDACDALTDKWKDTIGAAVKIGVGINSGQAQVGNAGSRRRLKYGPRGHTVNLASRVEGATKHFATPILISDSVQERIGDEFAVRRLCRVRVKGIDGDVGLFDLHGADADADEPWIRRRDAYEAALAHYEAGRFDEARQSLQQAADANDSQADGPCRLLADLIEAAAKSPDGAFSPVLELTSK